MKMLKFFLHFFICVLITFKVYSNESFDDQFEPIEQKTIEVLNQEFKKIAFQNVPKYYNQPFESIPKSENYSGLLRRFDKERLQLAYNACQPIIQEQKIFHLSDSNIKVLLKKMNFQIENSEILNRKFLTYKGLYIPGLNIIFLNSDLKTEEFKVDRLIHECIHAYQYQYRLPIDIITLENNKVSDDEKINLLSYYYEVEAHWLTQKVNMPLAWENYVKSFKESGLTFWIVYFSRVFTAGIVDYIGHAVHNTKVPVADRVPVFVDRNPGSPEADMANYWFTMPISTITDDHPGGISGSYSLNFHRMFLKSLASAQFSGRDTFLFEKSGRDQKIFSDLNDNFYNYILKLNSTQNPRILRINFSKILNGQITENDIQFEKELSLATASVLNKTTHPSPVNAVSVLKKYSDQFNKKNAQDLKTLQEIRDRNKISVLQMGGEGSSPEIELLPLGKVIPFIQFQPNVEFSPLVTDENILQKTEEAPYDIGD